MATAPQARRNTNLDALRAIAILMVLGHHAGQAIALLHGSNGYTVHWGESRVGGRGSLFPDRPAF